MKDRPQFLCLACGERTITSHPPQNGVNCCECGSPRMHWLNAEAFVPGLNRKGYDHGNQEKTEDVHESG